MLPKVKCHEVNCKNHRYMIYYMHTCFIQNLNMRYSILKFEHKVLHLGDTIFWLDLLNVLRPPFCALTTHSWLNWVDEDDWWGWGWLERKAIHLNYTRSTGSAGKGLDSQLCHYRELQTRERARSSLPGGSWEGWNPYTGAPPTTGLLVVLGPQSKDSWFCLG